MWGEKGGVGVYKYIVNYFLIIFGNFSFGAGNRRVGNGFTFFWKCCETRFFGGIFVEAGLGRYILLHIQMPQIQSGFPAILVSFWQIVSLEGYMYSAKVSLSRLWMLLSLLPCCHLPCAAVNNTKCFFFGVAR